MLELQAIEKLDSPSPTAFVHSMFEVDKKNTVEKRPILNCRPLNQFIPVEHFKQEGLRTVKEVLQPGDYMTSVDLRHAYVHVGLAPQERDLFTFHYDNQWYRYRVMPFGLNMAPRVFTKIVKAAASLVRQLGVRIVIYLDDSLIMANSRELCLQHTALWIRVLQLLGFVINLPKSTLDPAQLREFLGYLVDSLTMSIALPETKRSFIVQHCMNILSSPPNQLFTARELARTMGILTATSECCESSKLFTFHLHQDLLLAKRHGWDGYVALSDDTTKELRWWVRNLPSFPAKPILAAVPKLPALIRTDAAGGQCSMYRASSTAYLKANGPRRKHSNRTTFERCQLWCKLCELSSQWLRHRAGHTLSTCSPTTRQQWQLFSRWAICIPIPSTS